MLTTVATFTEPWEAHLFAGRLKAEGLMPSIAFENHVWNNWPIATALRGVQVQVPAHEAEDALAIFRASREGAYADLVTEACGPEPDNLKCPACGSREIRSWHTAKEFLTSFLSVFLGSLILPAQPSGWRCKACGTKWTAGAASGQMPSAPVGE